MTNNQVLVKMEHVRQCKMCSRGARAFFNRHNLNWSDFLTNGIPVEKIEATKDAMALKVAKVAKYGR